MHCRCREITQLTYNEAKHYADEHLDQIDIDVSGWIAHYRCPETGAEWLADWPHSELHGGGPMRLTRTSDPT
jgi:hypothetical protein